MGSMVDKPGERHASGNTVQAGSRLAYKLPNDSMAASGCPGS